MIVTHSNYDPAKAKERNYGISRTVPDKTLSLRQMIDRHMSGGRVKSFDPVYLNDATVIPMNFERMDLTERAQFLKKLPDFISDARGRLQTLRQAREEYERRQKYEEDLKKYNEMKARVETALKEGD